ncbi:MAG: flagellar basal body P-ring formation chaperone FlgA [Planctomycetota bacterium]|nr:flagellar basal body P-ring formation chaperone FlgA [Planctomycetota bacterium]
MNWRTFGLIWVVTATAAWAPAGVRIHLPREIAVSGSPLTLGAVGVIAADDPDIQKTVASLPMGRLPGPRETITVSRALVLSRLASAGLNGPDVKVTGAAEVTVRLSERQFTGPELIQAAQSLLKNLPATAGATWQADRMPADLSAPAGVEVQLQANLVGSPGGETVVVRLAAMNAKDELARTDVTFRRGHLVRQAVALKDIPAGAPLTGEAVRIEEVSLAQAPTSQWLPAPTAVALRPIAKGTVIAPAHVEAAAKPEVLVRRNASVVMRINGDGFTISAMGEAMQDGRAGEYIKVLNTDSKRIVIGKVMPDGSIQPKSDEVNR